MNAFESGAFGDANVMGAVNYVFLESTFFAHGIQQKFALAQSSVRRDAYYFGKGVFGVIGLFGLSSSE